MDGLNLQVEPPTPIASMSLAHLNNEPDTQREGFLQNFWDNCNNNEDRSRTSSPGLLGSAEEGGNESSNSSLNSALRRASVASNSSASHDEPAAATTSEPAAETTQDGTDNFAVPAAPSSFVVGPGPRLTSTGKVSHARKVPAFHIKRPRNAFIMFVVLYLFSKHVSAYLSTYRFRSHACSNNLVPKELGISDHRHISRIVGNLWKSLPALVQTSPDTCDLLIEIHQ